jgi:hypothetical protein
VLLAIRASQLEDDGVDSSLEKEITTVINEKSVKQRNPAYSLWVTRPSCPWLPPLVTLTHETLMHVSCCATSVAGRAGGAVCREGGGGQESPTGGRRGGEERLSRQWSRGCEEEEGPPVT